MKSNATFNCKLNFDEFLNLLMTNDKVSKQSSKFKKFFKGYTTYIFSPIYDEWNIVPEEYITWVIENVWLLKNVGKDDIEYIVYSDDNYAILANYTDDDTESF